MSGEESRAEDRRAGLAAAGRAAQELLIEQADMTQWALPERFTAPQLVGVGWYRGSVRLAQSCLVLQDAGFGHEAASLRRSLLEHMTALVWLADSGEIALDALQRGHQQWLVRLTAAMKGDDWPEIPPVARETLEAAVPASPEEHLQHMTQRLDAFDLRTLLPPWISDTGVAHPCLTSARYFWRQYEDGSVSLLDVPAVEDPLTTLTFNAVLLMLATLAVDRLLGGLESLHASAIAAGRLLALEPVLPQRRKGGEQ